MLFAKKNKEKVEKSKVVRTLESLLYGIENNEIDATDLVVMCQGADSMMEMSAIEFDITFKCNGDITNLPQ